MSRSINLNELYKIIETKLSLKDRVIIDLDGNACGGKTTLAEILKEKYQGTVIHIDDFYKPRDKSAILDVINNTDGNINYERFEKEILSNLDKQSLLYKRFNCTLQKEEDALDMKLSNLIIVEGTYSKNPRLHRYFDVSIFVKIMDKLQFERLKKRNPDNYDSFMNIWIKLERNYFRNYNIENECDYVIDGSNLIESEGSN